MSIQLKAIETVYNGYRFRSRLEARWAVFFDTLGVEYRYEPEGFDLNGIWYLPDFWLPEQQVWIEIKGQDPTEDELIKAYRLAMASGNKVFVFGGECWYTTGAYEFVPANFESYIDHKTLLSLALKEKNKEYLLSKQYYPLQGRWLSENDYRAYNDPDECDPDWLGHLRWGLNLEDKVVWAYPIYWIECPYCHKIYIRTDGYLCDCYKRSHNYFAETLERKVTHTVRLMEAYNAARQARFDGRD